jgi:hypothetical protein
MRNEFTVAMLAVLLGACASKERPLPRVVDASEVTHCAFIGRTVGDAHAGRDLTPIDRATRELQARKRAAALDATHIVWDTSGNFKGDAVAARVYRCPIK